MIMELADVLASLARDRQDETAWKSLYKTMWPLVWSVVFRRLHGLKAPSDDAAQEVFIRLLKSCPFDNLRDPDDFRAYTYRVSINVANNYLRTLLVEARAENIEEVGMLGSTDNNPEGILETDELLKEILGHIDERDHHILKLLIDGHSLREIASRVGISYSNTAVRVHRIRKKLLAHLRDTAARSQERRSKDTPSGLPSLLS